jgi:predicted XRE-type DNA-binding protein
VGQRLLTVREVAELLGVPRSRRSRCTDGHLARDSEDTLRELLAARSGDVAATAEDG